MTFTYQESRFTFGTEIDRGLCAWHSEMLRLLAGLQPFTCTPEWAAPVVQSYLSAGRLRATADGNAIREERDRGGLPATSSGELDFAWRATTKEEANAI